MKYFVCPTCGKKIPNDIAEILSHTEEDIVEEIKKSHPDWVESDGICKKCLAHYREQLHPKKGKISKQ